MTPPHPPTSGTASAGRGVLALLAAVALLYGVAAAMSPPLLGLYHDDGIYVGSALSLARGDGYRIAHLPDAPPQAKYPPLYPLLLAPLAWLTGGDPARLGLFRLPSLLAVLAALALLPRLFSRWGLSPRAALAATGLTALAPLVFQHALLALTEAPYLLLTLACFRLLPTSSEAASTGRMAAAAACGAAAVLTRSIGIALLPALFVAAWPRRRELRAWLPCLATGGASLAWALASLAMRRSDALESAGPLMDYYLGYGVWADPSPSLLLLVFTENLREIVLAAGDACLGWRTGGVPGWQLPAALLGLASLAGWLRLARSAPVEAVYLAATLVVVSLYPFDVARYFVPLTPLVAAGLLAGGGFALSRLRAPDFAAPAAVGLLAASALAVDLASFPRPDTLPVLNRRISATAYLEGASWLREHSDPRDVVVSEHDPWIHLATGRRAVPAGRYDHFWKYADASQKIDWPRLWGDGVRTAEQYGARWVFLSRHWHPVFHSLWLHQMQSQPEFYALRYEGEAEGIAIYEYLPAGERLREREVGERGVRER